MLRPVPAFISHYRVISPIGAGGMGEVYLAEDTRLNRQVAIKLLPANLTNDANRVRRFVQEAKAASALNHPNIMTVHDIGESADGLFLVMELVTGKTLRAVAGSPVPPALLLPWCSQMARALAAAHAAGITHRDLKPENIMVRDDGYIKVLDFGLARLAIAHSDGGDTTSIQLTAPGQLLGTVRYMSPEQARGETAGPPSDVFSLGLVFHELAAGRYPFQASTTVGCLHAINFQPVPPLDGVPAGLAALVGRMLEKLPAQRPRAAEVAEALAALDRSGLSASQAPSPAPAGDGGFWVAVLPFRRSGTAPELLMLAEGIAEEIITGLSRFSYLKVIAHSSTAQFTNDSADAPAVGRELGARYVLEGGLRQAGHRLRVQVQLIDTLSGTHIWAETYERNFDPDALFELQDDLVPRIVSTVADHHGVLLSSMSELLRSRTQEELTPYEAVLRSFSYSRKMTAEELTACRAGLLVAVKKAPEYADALAMLGFLDAQDYGQAYNLLADPLSSAFSAAQRAVELAPSNHLAWFSLAQALFFRKEFERFRHAVERAVTLNPMDGDTMAFLGELLVHSRQFERGLELAGRAKQLNPNHPGWYWYAECIHAFARRDFQAVLEFIGKVQLEDHWAMHATAAASHGHLGNLAAAAKSVQRLLQIRPDFNHMFLLGLERWQTSEASEIFVEGLRKAGLDME